MTDKDPLNSEGLSPEDSPHVRHIEDLHMPVLLNECLDMLAPAIDHPGAILIDATLGMGGHTEAALQRFSNLHVVGIDRDPQAISLASRRLARFGDRFQAVHATYDHIGQIASTVGKCGLVDGVLMDLGVSSLQLDEKNRGFSYSQDAPLDMRMDPSRGQSAADLIAAATEKEIVKILREYGEERFSPRIASLIIQEREKRPIATTADLVRIIDTAIPAPARRTGGNPSKRTFQALRIAVNNELSILQDAVPEALSHVRIGGRMVVEAYQSLEDRIVKKIFSKGLHNSAPPGLPVVPEEMSPTLVSLSRGAMQADQQERTRNPRSASVRLRGVEIISPWRQD